MGVTVMAGEGMVGGKVMATVVEVGVKTQMAVGLSVSLLHWAATSA
jgi:hypothetical protein